MFMINCFNVSEDEWLYADEDVEFAATFDVEDEQEAKELVEKLKEEYKYVQCNEN